MESEEVKTKDRCCKCENMTFTCNARIILALNNDYAVKTSHKIRTYKAQIL